MQISSRLKAVAAMVTSGSRIADVGTDHAYIPIFLALEGRIAGALAMDVNKGPLQKASENISLYGLEEQIETRLSDGLGMLEPGEAESIIIAGMGGPLTARILTDGKAKLTGCRELILQPQSEIRQVRKWLQEHSWKILEENMVFELGKYYPMMRAVPASSYVMDEVQLRYGPLLLASKHPVLREFLQRETQVQRNILKSLEGRTSETAAARRAEVEQEREITDTALGYWR